MNKKRSSTMMYILFLVSFIAAFNENIIPVALIDIMENFSVSASAAQWLVTGYMIVTATVVTLMGFILRRFTTRQLYFSACLFMIVGSAGAMVAPTFPLLLITRLIQAGGSGIFIPLMMNTVLTISPKPKLGENLSIGASMITFGPALGPVVGGFLVTAVGWRSIFIVPGIFALVMMIIGAIFLYNLGETEQVHLDVASVILVAFGLTLFVLGLNEISDNGILALIAIVAGVILIGIFVRRQNVLDEPVLNLSPLKKPRFLFSTIMVFIAMMTTFSMSVMLPLYFVGALNTTAFEAGLYILIPILINSAVALGAGHVMDTKGAFPLLPLGYLVIVLGEIGVSITSGNLGLVLVVVTSALVFIGVGMVFSPAQSAGLGVLDHEEHTHGISIMSVSTQIAACFGPALFIGILSSVSEARIATGMDSFQAQAEGFSHAIIVAAAIAFIGFAVSVAYIRVNSSQTKATRSFAQDARLEMIMKKDVFSVSSTACVLDAITIMREKQTTGLPIKDTQGNLVGIITDGDIMRVLANEAPIGMDMAVCMAAYEKSDPQFTKHIQKVLQLNVMDLATDKVISVDFNTPMAQVCGVLGSKRLKKVPVLKDNVLVGTISRGDVTRFILSQSTKDSVTS